MLRSFDKLVNLIFGKLCGLTISIVDIIAHCLDVEPVQLPLVIYPTCVTNSIRATFNDIVGLRRMSFESFGCGSISQTAANVVVH